MSVLGKREPSQVVMLFTGEKSNLVSYPVEVAHAPETVHCEEMDIRNLTTAF